MAAAAAESDDDDRTRPLRVELHEWAGRRGRGEMSVHLRIYLSMEADQDFKALVGGRLNMIITRPTLNRRTEFARLYEHSPERSVMWARRISVRVLALNDSPDWL